MAKRVPTLATVMTECRRKRLCLEIDFRNEKDDDNPYHPEVTIRVKSFADDFKPVSRVFSGRPHLASIIKRCVRIAEGKEAP